MLSNNRKTAAEMTRADLLMALVSFAHQRPGIEPANYASWRDYRAEAREVTADLQDFQRLVTAVSWRESEISADAIRAELQGSGRLTLADDGRLDYCTGQYFPTEYRKAACRALASLLWAAGRNGAALNWAEPTPEGRKITGNSIRKWARREFGRRIASRYFN